MQKINRREIGKRYEKYAMKRLNILGFSNIKWATEHKYLPYDITAEKNGKKFYIEVKYGEKNFSLDLWRIAQLEKFGDKILFFLISKNKEELITLEELKRRKKIDEQDIVNIKTSKLRKSSLVELFQNNPRIRVIDFLIENEIFDYSKKDIAKYSDISWNTLERFFNHLVKRGLVIRTRKVGKSDMYKINLENPIVKKLIEMDKGLMLGSIVDETESKIKVKLQQRVRS